MASRKRRRTAQAGGIPMQPICVHRLSSAVFISSALYKSGLHDALEVAWGHIGAPGNMHSAAAVG